MTSATGKNGALSIIPKSLLPAPIGEELHLFKKTHKKGKIYFLFCNFVYV
jgi:hypothetical protein